jgi:PAS domain S-box-containing protein
MPPNASLPPPAEPVRARKTSVVAQLTLFVAATLVVLLGVVLAVSYTVGRSILRDQIDDRLSAIAESRRDFVTEWVGRQQDRVTIFALRGVLRNFLEKHVAKESEEPQRTQSQDNLDGHVRSGAALVARIVSREGQVLLSSDPAEVGRDLSSDPTFQAGLKDASISVPSREGEAFFVDLAAPTRWVDGSRATLGVVMLKVSATPLATALRAQTGLGQTGEVLLGVRQGSQVRFLFPPRFRPDLVLATPAQAPAMVAATEGRKIFQHNIDYRGEQVLTAARPLDYGGWGLVAKMDQREAYAPIERLWHLVLAVGITAAVAGLVCAGLAARTFARPIQRLVGAAEAVTRGDLAASVPVDSDNELGLLARTFNAMTAALRTRTTEREKAETELKAERTLLRTLIDVLPLAIYVKDADGRFLVASTECARSIGVSSPDKLLGRTDADFFPPAIAAAFLTAEQRVLAGESILNLEEDSVNADGTSRIELTSKVPLHDSTGKIVGLVGVSRDITQRRRAEQAVRASEELLRSITDHTEDIIFVKDRESRTIFKNPAGLRANAMPAEKVIGYSDAEFGVDAEQVAKFLADDRRIMGSGKTEVVEEVLTSATGKKHVLLTTKTPRFDSKGNVIGLVGVARDITAQKLAEAALRESEQRLRTLGDNIPGGAIYQLIVSPAGHAHYAYMSAGIERIFGIPTDLVLGDPEALWGLILDDDRKRVALAQAESARKMTAFDCEFRQRTLRGEIKWLHARSTPRRLPDGSLCWDGVLTDITERKAAEAAVLESNERYELVVKGANAGIWDWDVPRKRVYYSARWKAMRGFSENEISSREEEWSDRIHPEDRDRVITALRAHVGGLTPVFAEEYRVLCKDGSWKWVSDQGIALRNAEGEAVRVAGSENDIHERKRAEEEIKASLHEKEVLLREIHHRVKNNLQIVSSLLNLQGRGHPALSGIFASTRDRVHAMAAVHERLYQSGDFARIDLGAHLSALARALTRAHAPAGVRVHLDLQLEPVTVELNAAVPLSLIANELLLNALKYAFAGRKDGTVTVSLQTDGDHRQLLVADDGPGIPTAIDPMTTRSLGLRLVRDLAHQIRAELRIDSEGAGMKVWIRWPAQPAPSERVTSDEPPGVPII